jgi:2-polyprenyl-6-hydroxyphenyl methylase/3-demethylubiquinone-9 3-methyltransferase
VFDFGKNWQSYSENRLDEQRVIAAVESLYALLQRQTLDGLKVLDLGCGSGLFSIAAARMGAGNVLGIDNNPACITVAQLNAARFSPGAPVVFRQGSILDTDALHALGVF